jgi:hypothetical protein
LNFADAGCRNNADVVCSDELESTERSSARETRGQPDYRFFLNASVNLLTYKELFESNTYRPFYRKLHETYRCILSLPHLGEKEEHFIGET